MIQFATIQNNTHILDTGKWLAPQIVAPLFPRKVVNYDGYTEGKTLQKWVNDYLIKEKINIHGFAARINMSYSNITNLYNRKVLSRKVYNRFNALGYENNLPVNRRGDAKN